MGWRGAGGNGASDTGTLYFRSTRAELYTLLTLSPVQLRISSSAASS